MILGRGKCKFKEDGIRALPDNAKTSQNWESTRLNSASLGRNFSINLREKGFKTKTKHKKMKVNWPLYLVKFMRHKDVNATTKVSHFDVLSIAVSKAEAANLWVMLQRNE